MQTAAGVFAADGRADLEQHGAGVQPGLHLHDGNAGFAVAGLDGSLDGRCAAPARQQGGVAVDTAQARDVQHRLRQDQPVGHHHQQVRL